MQYNFIEDMHLSDLSDNTQSITPWYNLLHIFIRVRWRFDILFYAERKIGWKTIIFIKTLFVNYYAALSIGSIHFRRIFAYPVKYYNFLLCTRYSLKLEWTQFGLDSINTHWNALCNYWNRVRIVYVQIWVSIIIAF